MPGRLILILMQLLIGWYVALAVIKALPNVGNLNIFLLAAVFAILVWAIGLLGAAILKGVGTPSPSTLLFALGCAVLFSALSLFPEVNKAIVSVIGRFDVRLYPLIGAVIGYAIQN